MSGVPMATLAAATLTAALVAPSPAAAEAAEAPSSLQAKLAAIAALGKQSGATVGIFVEHLERKETAGVDATRPFPMASTFKLPLAVVVLRDVERKELPPLDGKVRLLATDMVPGVSPLYDRMPNGGDTTLRELLASMLETSDNSAADALLRLAGGPGKVTAALVALGLSGISIDRGEAELTLDSHGVKHPPPASWTAEGLRAAKRGVSEAQHRAALAKFRADPRDHASPAAMGRLVARLWRGDLLAPAQAAFLREEMSRSRTGTRRLRAGVPAGTAVADRTGTCDGPGREGADCANAVGLVTLPSGEHVVVAVYVEDSGADVPSKEQLIAAVARAVWDRYTVSRGR
jgi:beta-lactamase class A